jgi:CubicO group peptidase (beta-lactamase class C family)
MDDLVLAHRLRAVVGRSVPGVAVVVVDADGVRARAAVGVADLPSGASASTEMSCLWFSMTKLVTVTAAMRLGEARLLDLDEPVLKHVPSVALLEPTRDAARITARHLMSHSAGIANPIPLSWIHRPDEAAPDLEEWVDRLLRKHRRLRFEPGTRSSYTNVGMLVLGIAMQRVTSSAFADVIILQVLEPLKMRRTGFGLQAQGPSATGHHPRWSPMRFLLPRWAIGEPIGRWIALRPFLVDGAPYGGLVGPIEDAARFLRMHLRDGEIDGVHLMTPAMASAMREITTTGRRFDLGLGWLRPSKARSAGPPFVEHLGGGAGFFSVMRLYLKRRIGVAVMGNATHYDIDAVAALALE